MKTIMIAAILLVASSAEAQHKMKPNSKTPHFQAPQEHVKHPKPQPLAPMPNLTITTIPSSNTLNPPVVSSPPVVASPPVPGLQMPAMPETTPR